MSDSRQQVWIEAPLQVVWELIADVDRHPEWWPRVVAVQCEGLEEGCTYREVVQSPVGKEKMELEVERLDDCEELAMRCLNTGPSSSSRSPRLRAGRSSTADGHGPHRGRVPGRRLDRRPALLPRLARRLARGDARRGRLASP